MENNLTPKLVSAVEAMPAFPASVHKILALTQDPACTPKDLVAVIAHDPVLSAKMLRVVNSPYFGVQKPITKLDQTVVYLGFNTIKNLAISIASIGILPKTNKAGLDIQQYLLHSLAVAGIAKQLARHAGMQEDADECFIAGLLHDIGKIVLVQAMPNEFRIALDISREYGMSLHLAVRKAIGTDHSALGADLAQRWRFPERLCAAIRYQFGPELIDADLVVIVFVANQISKKLGFGFAGNVHVDELPPFVVARMGGDLDHLIYQMGGVISQLRDAQAFILDD